METNNPNKTFTLKLHPDGYYELCIFDNYEIQIKDVLEIIDTQKQLGGKKIPNLISGGKYSITNLETLKFVSKNENMPYSLASAFITSSISQKLLGNFYLKTFKPERPTKIFNSKEEALIWLKQYL